MEEVNRPPVEREKRPRRRRSDYGAVFTTQRDLELFQFVGEQYAVTLPQLARLIDRSTHTARSLRDRWKRAGWINSGRLAVDLPSFVWLTGRGAVGSPFRVWQPHHGLAVHIAAVTDVRLLIEHDLGLGRWECERAVAQAIARERGGHRRHLPDGVLRTHNEQIAIEVELTLKSRDRLEKLVEDLCVDYTRTWYFAKPPIAETLREQISETGYRNIDVYSHPPRAEEFSFAPTRIDEEEPWDGSAEPGWESPW